MNRVLCIGRNIEKLNEMKALVTQVLHSANVEVIDNLDNVYYEVSRKEYMAVLTEAMDGDFDGLRVARRIHDISPLTKVIFVNSSEQYALPAFKTRASGYLVDLEYESLKSEFEDLHIGLDSAKNHKIEAKTFGNFELLCDGHAVKFTRAKSKELIAYLIDKRGTSASTSELIVNLWEDKDVDKSTRSMLHNLIADIRDTFLKYGISDLFDTKRNSFRIDDKLIESDYFKLLDGDKSAIKKFSGEYMNSYSWADMTAGVLYEKAGMM